MNSTKGEEKYSNGNGGVMVSPCGGTLKRRPCERTANVVMGTPRCAQKKVPKGDDSRTRSKDKRGVEQHGKTGGEKPSVGQLKSCAQEGERGKRLPMQRGGKRLPPRARVGARRYFNVIRYVEFVIGGFGVTHRGGNDLSSWGRGRKLSCGGLDN